MIFVTVGTHEQQFNRLIEYMDKWAEEHEEEVVIQIGYSTYEPKNCKWQKMYSYKDMNEYVDKARIVITHGGPSSFIMPLQRGKVPIVVPRQKEYGEHVNNHQIDFCKDLKNRSDAIIVIEDMSEMSRIIDNYDSNNIQKKKFNNNTIFCSKVSELIESMFA